MIFLILFFLIGVRDVLAQSPTGLSLVVSPLPINLVTTPGSTISAQLKVKNGGTAEETIAVDLMKFGVLDEDGKAKLMEREKGDDYFDWVTFSEKEFKVAPNEWKTITMDINVPENASFGYYYAVTFARKDEVIPGGERTTKILGATATLVLLEVRVPNAVRDIEVLEFSTPKKFYEFLPAEFFIKLKNKGNVHVVPKGNVFIDGLGKKDVAIILLNEDKGNVLPNSNRIFRTEWKDGFPVFEKGKLKWDFTQVTKLRWGKFNAKMLLVYDDGQRDVPIEGELSFYVVPWRLIGVGTVLLLLILRGLYSTLKPPIIRLVKKIKQR